MASTVSGSSAAIVPFWDPPADIIVNGVRVPRRQGNDDAKPILYGVGATYQENPWDVVFIGGDPVPGICRVHGLPTLAVDKKKTAGRNGAAITTNGYIPGPIEIEVVLWTQDQWDTFVETIAPVVWANPKKKASQVRGAGAGKALTVSHPALDLWRLNLAVVVGVSAPEPGPVPGSILIKIKTLEFVPPDAKAATKTVKAAVKKAALDPHLEPDANLGGRAPPSTTGLDPT